jgi:hypothetical protein
VVEACSGGGKGKGRERSGDGGGRGEKRRGPREASGGARDGGLKTEETGKRKRQSSERSIDGGEERRGSGGAGRRRGPERPEKKRGVWGLWVCVSVQRTAVVCSKA